MKMEDGRWKFGFGVFSSWFSNPKLYTSNPISDLSSSIFSHLPSSQQESPLRGAFVVLDTCTLGMKTLLMNHALIEGW